MTSRLLYEGVLIELNKENAPNILLEDFNYFANKAINNYVNKRYNIYDINQQTTDDLRVLKATAMLKPEKIDEYTGLTMAGDDHMATYEVIMPSDYLHILNCICIYRVNKTYKCYNAGDTWRSPAKRLTADMYSQVLDNFWNRPSYKNPYYYIHNVNSIDGTDKSTVNGKTVDLNFTKTTVPTSPYYEQGTWNQSTLTWETRGLTKGEKVIATTLPKNLLTLTNNQVIIYDSEKIPKSYEYTYGEQIVDSGREERELRRVKTSVTFEPTSNFVKTGEYTKTVTKELEKYTYQTDLDPIVDGIKETQTVSQGSINDTGKFVGNIDKIGKEFLYLDSSLVDKDSITATELNLDQSAPKAPTINGTTPFEKATEVTLNSETQGATIYYWLSDYKVNNTLWNVNNIVTNGYEYKGPFKLTKTKWVVAVAILEDNSEVGYIDSGLSLRLFKQLYDKTTSTTPVYNSENGTNSGTNSGTNEPSENLPVSPQINTSGTDGNLNVNIENNVLYGKDYHGNFIVDGKDNIPTYIIPNDGIEISNIERGAGIRYGNVSQVRLEIRYGTDDLIFLLVNVYVDYIKAPQNIRLTQKEIDLTEDTSQMLEYPDYVCQEIINELVHLVMENISDLRLQTHPVVSLSIANPAQALAPALGLNA